MDELKIYGLRNKQNERVYGSCQTLIDNDFDKGNLSRFLTGQRVSINGYSKLIDFQILNERYDTLIFNSRNLVVNHYWLSQFLNAKEEALLQNKEFIVYNIMSFDWLVKKRSVSFYNVSFYYQNLFLFHMASDKVQIKVLSSAFYLCTYEEILAQLTYICVGLFGMSLNECFIVNRVDYAIDIKFDFDLIQHVIEGPKDFKFWTGQGKYKIFNENQRGKSITLDCGAVQYIIYDKPLEIFQNEEKKSLYKDLFSINFNNEFELEEYLKDSQRNIVRFEYRIKNNSGFLEKKQITPNDVFRNNQKVKKLIYDLLNVHTAFQIPEEQILKEIYNSDTEIVNLKYDEDENLEQQLFSVLKIFYRYLASLQARKMIIDSDYNFDSTFEKVLNLVKCNFDNYNYEEKLSNKVAEIMNKKYK